MFFYHLELAKVGEFCFLGMFPKGKPNIPGTGECKMMWCTCALFA